MTLSSRLCWGWWLLGGPGCAGVWAAKTQAWAPEAPMAPLGRLASHSGSMGCPPPTPLPPLPLPLKRARSGSVCGVARLSHGAHGSCCGQKAWDHAGVVGSQVRIRKRPVSPRALPTPLSGRLALMVSFPRQDWVQAPALSPLGARACGKFCVAYVSPCSSPDQFPVQRMSLGGPRGAPAPGGASR